MSSVRKAASSVFLASLVVVFAGCSNKFLDPTQIGRFRPTPAVNVILDSLGVAEEAPVAWQAAHEPQPKDIVAVRGDYTLRAGDLVRVSIFELYQEGATVVNDYVVSETGKVSIPEVGVIQAAGLTETQLEEEIRQALSPGVLKEPSVTVTLMNSQQRTFSILGNGVPQPGRYGLPRYDFRLTDALATAGGPMQFNVSTIYVARAQDVTGTIPATGPTQRNGDELELVAPPSSQDTPLPSPSIAPSGPQSIATPQGDIPVPSQPAEKFELEREMLDLIAPSADARLRTDQAPAVGRFDRFQQQDVSASVLPPGYRLLGSDKSTPERPPRPDDVLITPSEFGGGSAREADRSAGSLPESGDRVEWVFQNGKWVQIHVHSGQEGSPSTPLPQASLPQERQPQNRQQQETAGNETPAGGIEWVFKDGQWIPVAKGQTPPPPAPPVTKPRAETEPTKPETLPMDAEWEEAVQTRLIKIPADKLMAGDPRYNVVIKPGDTIYVPVDVIGEFCIMGNVNRAGFIGLTGRPMTLKMAIAAAGGLGPLAYPKTCEVVRRLGDDREEIVMVDLDKIASGEQPDFFIKPNDLINVGTHPTARWRATLRNAFRAAYGFAFVYDRNFVYRDDYYGTSLF